MSTPLPPEQTVDETSAPTSVVDEGQPRPVLPSLSPSRASDFMTCPLMYRFRVLDRLPQKPSRAAARGTLVHAVLEQLFDLPASERTHANASEKLSPTWDALVETAPELTELFTETVAPGAEGAGTADGPVVVDSDGVTSFLVESENLLGRYFTLEDPSRLEPAEREIRVETTLASGLQLRGIIDRLDIAPTGEIRVVDYKTGRAPSEVFEAKALFQMKFYALVLWRVRGIIPTLLQLVYLGGDGELIRYAPEERDLLATERKLVALWSAIERAYATGDWRPSPSRLCTWCDYQAICPTFGGTPPPLPPSQLVTAADHAAADPAAAERASTRVEPIGVGSPRRD